jgi:TPR repeat protein
MRPLLGWCLALVAGALAAQPAPELVARAESGEVEAQRELGQMYAEGREFARNDDAARDWLRKAAERGDAGAQAELGRLYARHYASEPFEADGADFDTEAYGPEALKWYRLSAEQGDRYGAMWLADFLLTRMAGYDHDAEALGWYRKAAEQSMTRAQRTLGLLYAEGRGAPRNRVESFDWYRRAAEAGDPEAQFQLARAFQRGLGVTADSDAAAKWFHEAAARGNIPAQATLRSQQQPPGGPCDWSKPTPKGWRTVTASMALLIDLPPALKSSKFREIDGGGSKLAFRGIEVTLRGGEASDANHGELTMQGGAACSVLTHAGDDGSGNITLSWPDVGRAHFSRQLTVSFPKAADQPIACAIAASARLFDDLADLSLVRIVHGKEPSAILRNLAGVERQVKRGDDVSRDTGTLYAIERDRVEVLEVHPNGRGGWVEKLVELRPE